MKVMLLGEGVMGEIARQTLRKLPVTLVEPDPVLEHAVCDEYDVLFSASWTRKIPRWMCDRAKLCAVNIHTSLLPEGRGSHPLNWALIWGRTKTGITIHKITDTYDAGDIVFQKEIPILFVDNIVSLRQRVESVFPRVISSFFEDVSGHLSRAVQQNQAHASYAQKRTTEDGLVNFEASDLEIYNFIRAHDPVNYPAFYYQNGEKKIITHATYKDGKVQWG